jgi:hypothetical protein
LRGAAACGGVALFDADAAGTEAVSVLPRIEVGGGQGSDWSAVAMRGREIRTAVTVRVADGQRARLGALVAAVEAAGEALAGNIGGWRVAAAAFVRSKPVAEKGGAAVLVEHRVRVMEIQGAA